MQIHDWFMNNVKINKSRCLNLNSPLYELIDIYVNGQKVIAMQNSNTSQLTYILNVAAMRMRAVPRHIL